MPIHYLLADDQPEPPAFWGAIQANGLVGKCQVFSSISELLEFLDETSEREGSSFKAVLFLNEVVANQDSLFVLAYLKETKLLDKVKVVMLAHVLSPTRFARAFEGGVCSVLLKPLKASDLNHLISTIPEFFGKKRMNHPLVSGGGIARTSQDSQ